MFVVMCYSSPREQIQPALHSPAQDIARTPLTTLQAAIGQARPHRMHALDGQTAHHLWSLSAPEF